MESGPEMNWQERWLGWAAGGLFVWAGLLKALDPGEFAAAISAYQLLPWPASVAGAFFLPWLEIVCGGCLLANWCKPGALRILLLLMLLFINALLTAWARGLNIECGCFGRALASSNYPLLLLRDAVIFALLARLLFLEWKRRALEEEKENPAT